MVLSHRLRCPPLLSAWASDRLVISIPAQAKGSGGKGIGLERTMSRRVRTVSSPESRSSITSAPKRVEPTPRPVNPAAYATRP